MEVPYEASSNEGVNHRTQIIKCSPYKPYANLAWFDLRVFYVRISNFQVDGSTPEFFTLNHIPLNPDTLLELNGVRSSMHSDGLSSVLRRDRVDKKSEETTFVSTDSIRLTGSMKFEVNNKEDCILSGVLEMSSGNGFTGKSNFNAKRWSMSCETEITASTGILKMKNVTSPEITCPSIEVYVAGCFSGTPIILTKTLQLSFQKKQNRRCLLDAIPEYETTDSQRDVSDGLDLQVADFRRFKYESEGDYNGMYFQGTRYIDGEDSELSWFNAGVRVGVGLGLGICLVSKSHIGEAWEGAGLYKRARCTPMRALMWRKGNGSFPPWGRSKVDGHGGVVGFATWIAAHSYESSFGGEGNGPVTLGVGVGVGLLVRSYKTATRILHRRLI